MSEEYFPLVQAIAVIVISALVLKALYFFFAQTGKVYKKHRTECSMAIDATIGLSSLTYIIFKGRFNPEAVATLGEVSMMVLSGIAFLVCAAGFLLGLRIRRFEKSLINGINAGAYPKG